MATVDNRIVQLEFKNAEFAKAMAATLEAIKALNEALKTVGGDSSFANVTEGAEDMSSRIGTAVKTIAASIPDIAARAGDTATRFVEAGARMATGLLPIGKSAEEATKKLQGVSTGADSFTKINDAASRVSLAPISTSVDKVSARFLVMSTVAITALSNITNKAIDTGTQVLKSLSVDQVTAGFAEYELKLGSIQTIMAGTGESLSTVNGYLDELNTYADRTIYSFADMTQNIGKFTNAGVDLDTSVASIQGVAQVAALSGANTNEASRAMYNFAQALSKGYVQLIDWKSIELANMGTTEFKTQLVEAAEAMGTLTKEGDKWVTEAGSEIGPKMQGFNDALTDQFLTTDVLTTTLAKYSDETTELGKRAFAASSDIKTFTQLMDVLKESIGSGFARSFEILIGDFDQAKKLFGAVGDAVVGFVDRTSAARNDMLQLFADMGGRQTVIWALRDAFQAIGHILEPIGRAFREVFPKNTAQDWVVLADKFRNLIGAMEPSAQTMTNLHRIFKGLFSAMKIGKTVIRSLFDAFSDFLSGIGFGKGNILELAAGFGDFFTELEKGMVTGEGIKNLFKSLDPGEAGGKIKNALGKIPGYLDSVWTSIQDIWGKISEWFSTIGTAFADAIDPTSFSAAGEVVSVGLLSAIAVGIGKLLKEGMDFGPSGFFDGITDALGELTGVLTAIQENLRAGALLKIAASIAILAVSLALLAAVDAAKLASASGAMTAMMAQLVAVVASLKALSLGFSSLTIATTAAALLLISASLLVLAFALEKIGELDIDTIGKGLYGIASGLTGLVLAINNMNAKGNLVKAGLSMLLMSAALLVMGSAMEKIGALDMDTIGKGLYGLAGGMIILVSAVNLVPQGRLIAMGASLILVAVALRILASAMAAFASLTLDQIAIGLYAMASALTAIGLAMKFFPDNILGTAGGLLLAAIAMRILASALEAFGSMTLDEIAIGLYAMGSSLLFLGIALTAMTGTLAGAAALMVAAIAVRLLVGALEGLAQLSIAQLATGLVAMAVGLGLLAAVGVLLAGVSPALILTGAGLLLIGGAVALMGIGLAATAKGLQIIAEVGLTAIKVVIEAVGELIKLIPLIAAAIIDTLVIVAEGLPALLKPLGAFVVEIIGLFIELVPKIVEAVGVLISGVITLLTEKIPEFIDLGLLILTSLLQGVSENIEDITVAVVGIITGLIDGLTEAIPDFVDSVVEFMTTAWTEIAEALGENMVTIGPTIAMAFLDGFIKGLKEILPEIWDFFTELPGEILDIIKAGFGIKSPSKEMQKIGVDVIKGLVNGVVDAAVAVWNFFTELPGKILGFVSDAASWLIDAGSSLLGGFFNGIVDGAVAVWNWHSRIRDKILGYFSSALTWIKDKGKQILTGLWNGIKNGAEAVWTFFRELPGKLKDKIPNPLGILSGIGKKIFDGLFQGMKDAWNTGKDWLGGIGSSIISLKGPPAKDAVLLVGVGGLIFDGLLVGMKKGWDKSAEWLNQVNPADEMDDAAIAREFQAIAEQIMLSMEGMDMTPTITPVVDLTQVERGLSRVNGFAPTVSVGAANAISAQLEPSEDEEVGGSLSGKSGGVVFNQTINSPTQLSETEIYRNTRNQITLAKEELEIP